MRRSGFVGLVAAVLALSACGPPDSVPPEAGPEQRCPSALPSTAGDPWVPAPPTTETAGRLVPDADPVDVLVCRYGDLAGSDSAALEVDGRLQDGRELIRTDLLLPARVEGVERVCTSVGGPVVPHLARLRYADGELWLSAVQEPNGCTASGNGAFVSSAYLGDRLAEALRSGSWLQPDQDPCAQGRQGRAGQEQALAPAGWTSLVVCTEDGAPRAIARDRAGQVVSLLGQLETRPGTNACDGVPTSSSSLVLSYADGPPVELRWTPVCEPSLGNGSLSAVPTPAQTELLQVLLG